MTCHLDSYTTNDVKLEMLSGVQTGNRIPHDEYNVRGIAHARAYLKDNIFMQRRLVQALRLKGQSFVQKVQSLTKLSRPKHILACRSEFKYVLIYVTWSTSIKKLLMYQHRYTLFRGGGH